MEAEVQLPHCTQVYSGKTLPGWLILFLVVNDYRTVPSLFLSSPFGQLIHKRHRLLDFQEPGSIHHFIKVLCFGATAGGETIDL